MEGHEDVELASRRNGGVAVRLTWRRVDGTCRVAVEDEGTGEVFELRVARDRALDAYYHPYAYADAA
jgi:hypothetical protein